MAIAYAVDLAAGNNPSDIMYLQRAIHSHISQQAWKFGKFRETIHRYSVCTPCGNNETFSEIFVSLSRYWQKRHLNYGN